MADDSSKPAVNPREATFPLMAMACLLIANSHLEGLYPRSWMAADGLLGNSIFFLLAGYGVAVSQSKRPYGLGLFYWRRVMRIYPTLLVVMFLGWAFHLSRRPESVLEVGQQLVWPTHYKFIAQIMIFYPAAWLLARFDFVKVRLVLLAAAVVWLAFVGQTASQAASSGETISLGSLPATVWWSFFFGVFLMGTLQGKRDAERGDLPPEKPILIALVVAGCFAVYVALKFLYSRGQLDSLPPTVSCAMLQGLGFVIVSAIFFLKHQIQALLNVIGLQKAAVWLGKSSLQVYLCHMWFAHLLERMALPWPIKVVFFFVASIIAAWGLRMAMEAAERWLARRKERS